MQNGIISGETSPASVLFRWSQISLIEYIITVHQCVIPVSPATFV